MIHVDMPSDEQWRNIKEMDEDVAEVAQMYNDSSAFTVYTRLYMTAHHTCG